MVVLIWCLPALTNCACLYNSSPYLLRLTVNLPYIEKIKAINTLQRVYSYIWHKFNEQAISFLQCINCPVIDKNLYGLHKFFYSRNNSVIGRVRKITYYNCNIRKKTGKIVAVAKISYLLYLTYYYSYKMKTKKIITLLCDPYINGRICFRVSQFLILLHEKNRSMCDLLRY